MAEAIDGEYRFEIWTNEFSVRIDHAPGDINTLQVQEEWPRDLPPELRKSLICEELDRSDSAEARIWLKFGIDKDRMKRHRNTERYGGAIACMGYSSEYQSLDGGNVTFVERTMRYPSVKRLNEFNQNVLGGNGLEFVRFEGSEFEAIDSTIDFVNEGEENGKVLIASHPAYEYHDTIDHAIVNMFTGLALNNYLRQGWGMHLSRARAEWALLPDIPGQHASENAERAFFPSTAVIFDAAEHRESITARLANQLFFPSEQHLYDADIKNRVNRVVSDLLKVVNKASSLQLKNILGDPPPARKVTAEILDRCERAEEFARTSARVIAS